MKPVAGGLALVTGGGWVPSLLASLPGCPALLPRFPVVSLSRRRGIARPPATGSDASGIAGV
ncbi:MAG: hypothetical protein KDM63_16425 [Verrucomicrobiae bacterium]|nr:hypothetical protein [Verrucomicrobiae bacterium]